MIGMRNVNRGAMNCNISQTQRLDAAIRQPERQSRFLAAFAACGSIERASRSAQVHRQTHYFWMREDLTYPRRFKEAEVQAARALEDEAVRRAREGIRKPVLHRGKQVYVQGEPLFTTEYSDSLLMFLLKASNPERFRERLEQTNLLDIDPDKVPPELLDKIANRMIEQALGSQAAVEEVNRRLAAGESVAFEDVAKAIEAPGAPLTIDAVCQAVNDRPGQR
jgi:hypothetical protein